MSDLTLIKEKLEKATGHDRQLDAAIARGLGAEARFIGKTGWRMRRAPWNSWSSSYWESLPEFTGSLDASLALVERLLPDGDLPNLIEMRRGLDGFWSASIDAVRLTRGTARTPATALLSALVTALAQKEEKNV